MNKKTYNTTTVARSAKPRSKRLRDAGYSSITIVGGSADGGSGDAHSHANKSALDTLLLAPDRYLSATLYDKDTDTSTTGKIKAGYADKADKARYAVNADDAEQWSGHQFADYLDQPVRKGDKVRFEQVTTPAVTTPDFVPGGFAGAGVGLVTYANGQTGVEVDHIVARRTVRVNEVIINQAAHVGGRTLYSAANMECVRVVNGGTYWRCFFDTKNGQRANLWKVGDQAYCQRYSPDGTQLLSYYWRLVTSVGEDWINLSVTVCDGVGTPAEGDNIIQVGSQTDPDRQAMLEIDQTSGGRVVQYAGINSFNFANRNEVAFGVNDQGKPFFYAYGDLFVGDRDLLDSDATYITFQTPEGETRRRMIVSADLRIGRGSTGLTNLSEWAGKQQQIDLARETASKAMEEATAVRFLKDAFAGSSTDISGGVVLSGFMGVRDDDDYVAAGMAGRNFILNRPFTADDETCPMIFAGNVGVTANANKAKTRIYPSGLLYTNKLNADGGIIGGFEIGENWLVASGVDYSVQLSAAVIYLEKKDDDYENSTSLASYPSPSLGSANHVGISVNVRRKTDATINARNIGINLSVEGKYDNGILHRNTLTGNYALYIDKGLIAGTRYPVRSVSQDYYISVMDHFIDIYSNSVLNIYLPANPELGQEYFISSETNTVHKLICLGGHKIATPGSAYASNSTAGRGVSHVYFTGVKWQYSWASYK